MARPFSRPLPRVGFAASRVRYSKFETQRVRLSRPKVVRGGQPAMTDSVDADLQRGLAGHPTADPVLEAVTKRIVQITRQYERAMREVTARHGISLGDAEVLFTLAHSESPHHTPGELARTFQITPGSMTTRLARLERAGYIERHIDPTNRVSIKVVLTPEGDQLHRRV